MTAIEAASKQRLKCWDEMRRLAFNALNFDAECPECGGSDGGRKFTAEEQQRWDELSAELDGLDAQIRDWLVSRVV